MKIFVILLFVVLSTTQTTSCTNSNDSTIPDLIEEEILPGSYLLDEYLGKLKNKTVGVVVNHTSRIRDHHTVDVLLNKGVEIIAIFSPEHGFKGKADPGEKVDDDLYLDSIPIYSLYGANRKPTDSQMTGIDVIVFDIQDVGARFYTYLSTLHYAMEAAAENNADFIVLDRPNPNIHYVDGPVLNLRFKSFVGMHPVPIVYGMSIGEYARMINGEGWLDNATKCRLEVIACKNYNRQSRYKLPIPPSPNLPNQRAVLLYPSLCLFEGTTCSVGRGTENQFQLLGHPSLIGESFSFTPHSNFGAQHPKHKDIKCYGYDLTSLDISDIYDLNRLNLSHLLQMSKALFAQDEAFFNDNNFFEKLAGTDQLRIQLLAGLTEEQIRATWQDDLDDFMNIRKQYILYK